MALQISGGNYAPPPGETHESMQRKPLSLVADDSAIRNHEQMRVRMVLDLFEPAQRARMPMEQNWQDEYDRYYAYDKEYKSKAEYKSKLVLPISFQIIETKTPQLVMSMFQQQPIYGVAPTGKDDAYKARITEQLLSWQLRQQKNAMLNHTLWIKDSFIYGGSICKTGWEYCEEYVPRNQPSQAVIDYATMTIMKQHQVVVDKIVTKDQPMMQNVDIGEIYPDPTATTIEDCRFIIHRMMVPYHKLKSWAQLGIYKNVDRLNAGKEMVYWASNFQQHRYSMQNLQDPYTISTNDIYNFVEILECWWLDPSDPYQAKYKTVVANRRELLQDLPLGEIFWHNRFPFKLLKNIPMSNEFWGISESKMTWNMQKMLSDFQNYRMDNAQAMLKAYWLVERTAGVNKEKMKKLKPGDIIFTNNINGVKADRPPRIDDMTAFSESQLRQEIMMTSNMNEATTGMSASGSKERSATGSSLKDQNAKTRWSLCAMLYTEQIGGVGEDFVALNQQFLTQPQMISIVGQDGLTMETPVDATMIPRNPNVYVTLGKELQGNKDLRKQLLIQIDPLIASTPGAKIVEWRKDMLRDFGFNSPERYFEGEFVMPDEVALGGNRQMPVSTFSKQMQGSWANGHPGGSIEANAGEMMEGMEFGV